ncbi:DUF2207 domain-containing protein [Actinomadura madurae]|uniref:DUF2207 domain-containing protein n=1 Tax=Actinomadura madurae TaxID=1993 RepID=UPI0020272E0A|nr:DUF2207 domain-containing protein [Actinomadura madurae]MCP9950738.1 DUF2207 domain-containing protein [Actinomadura madurae]MCP9967514.1 DUF2207 domain-containing protein [Actinomadura madurae]MCP9979966.1 DUF2207 domain-containing protein [Actinomadura madurae]MCQ0008501.1 DUF2207 domain-containing protein [Actinomadura madurae]URN06977.1 DUF2207 domain-containing protein [Actinomadura madurae]
MSALARLFRSRPVLLTVSAALSLPLATASPASAAGFRASERVLKDEVVITAVKGGTAKVKETIVYRFDGRDGFQRTYPTRTHESLTEDRVYKLDNLRASSPDGGPAKVTATSGDTTTTIKVSGGQKLTGDRTVVLEYDLRGAITPMGAAEELRWPVIGGWKVPLDEAKVTVDGGAVIRNVNCFTGPIGSTIGCTQYYTNHTKTQGVYAQQGMLPGEYLTVVAGLPAGTTGGKALYERRHTVATAFSVNAVTGAALAGLLVLLVGGVAVLYLLRGRDARVVGKKAAEGDHAPLAGAEFEPPDGVRPGQIGTLIDEQADVIDVTATIVDLAVRGYLLIEEEDRARTGRLDWTLRRLDRPQADLLPYERILLDALLTAPDGSGRDAVKLSELGGTFATKLAQVRSAMYDDVVKQGWFARRPDTVRSRWTVTGILVTLLGIAGTVALAFTTEWALAGLALIIAGAALAYGGQYMPAKTARGATVLAHTIGFRAFLERGVIPEGEGTASRQRIALFSRLLPYAVVFDAVPKWAQTVKDAGERAEGADNLYWYEGPAEWDLSKFAESMRTFLLATSGSISQSRGL